MTREQYTQYQQRFEWFIQREDINNLSALPNAEPFFSWRACECCGSTLGGDRENANGYCPDTQEVKEYVVCLDCLYYAEYGQLDDLTMMDMQE